MKKLCVNLIVCLMLICGAFAFSACGRNKTYDLGKLKEDYEKLPSTCQTVKLSGGQLVFDYSSFKKGDDAFLQTVVNTTEPYTRLNDFYNPLFHNIMSFTYNYIDVCSSNQIRVDSTTKSALDNGLEQLKAALKNVDDHVGSLADVVEFNLTNTKADKFISVDCAAKYTALFNSYDELFKVALNFNYELARVYFSKGLTTAIVDYSLVSLDDFNASQAAINLKSMADYQTLNLTRAYYNSYVKGNALTTVFTTKKDGAFPKPDANYNNYVASVNAVSLDATFTNALPQKMQVIENDASLKEQFYNQSIAMSNIQMIMDNDLSVYQLALNEVTYLDKKADPNATDYEKFCVQMIENHNYIVQQYNSVLENLINIIKNAEV